MRPSGRYPEAVDQRGSTLDGVRRRNLATVLERVHRSGPASRAQLTASTGLNRSTIAALVADLEAFGLVEKGDPLATSKVGRPSPLVSVSEHPVAIAVNPEVDSVTVGVVGLGARFDQVVRVPVDHIMTPGEAVDVIAGIVEGELAETIARRRVVGVGLAIPGLVRASDQVVRWAPHLGWRESAFADDLAARLGYPCFAGNDATLGAIAEHRFGSARGIADLVYLNGGPSGIGGGVVVANRLVGGAGGYAGEFGQNRPGLADAADRRTTDGTLEDEVSRGRLLDVLGLDNVDDPTLEAALMAAADDPEVRREVERQRRVLAVALANAINVLNPTLVALGGFLATLRAIDPERLDALVAECALDAAWEDVSIVPAALSGSQLLVGAAELAFAPVLADPAAFAVQS